MNIQNQIQESTKNKQEVLNLVKELKGLNKKINMMKSLNKKYISQ